MGMTIEEAEQYLIALKYCETCEATDTNVCKACSYHQRGSSAKCYDAIDVGVDTMRKYQKIMENIDKIKAEINILIAPKIYTEYQDGFMIVKKWYLI